MHQKKEAAIKMNMQYIDDAFKMACERSHFTNGNHFTFNNLYLAIESMENLISIISEIFADKKIYVDRYKLGAFKNMLKIAKETIDDVGKDYVPISEEKKAVNEP